LLTTAIPLAMTPIASIVAIAADGSVTLIPSWHSIEQAASVHVFAYSTHDQLLLAESEGSFDLQTWERAAAATKEACLRPETGDEERLETQPPLESLLRTAMESKFRQSRNWAGAAR
jgi:exosome complex component RRP46